MYVTLTEAMYQKRPKDVGGEDFNTSSPGRFTMKTKRDKIAVSQYNEKRVDIEQPLSQIFGDKVRIKQNPVNVKLLLDCDRRVDIKEVVLEIKKNIQNISAEI